MATLFVRPQVTKNYVEHPVAFVIPVAVAASLAVMFVSHRSANDRRAFLSSCVYLAAMLGGAACTLYPVLLPSSTPGVSDITIHNAAAGPYSLTYGVIWWTIGMAMAIGYFVLVYGMFRGKVSLHADGHGY